MSARLTVYNAKEAPSYEASRWQRAAALLAVEELKELSVIHDVS